MCLIVHIKHGTATGKEFSMMVCIWLMMNTCLIFIWTKHSSCNWIDWLKMMKTLAIAGEREASDCQCCILWCCSST